MMMVRIYFHASICIFWRNLFRTLTIPVLAGKFEIEFSQKLIDIYLEQEWFLINYVYTCIYIYVNIYICICTYTCIYAYVSMYV